MTKKLISSILLAASLFAISTGAEAGSRSNGAHASKGSVTIQHLSGRRHHGHRKDHRYHGGYFPGHRPHHACYIYKRKAEYTGSSYWRSLYKRCIYR